jgi:hypothetical protein
VTLGWDQGTCTYTQSLDTNTGAFKQECEFTFIFNEGPGSFTVTVRSRSILRFFEISNSLELVWGEVVNIHSAEGIVASRDVVSCARVRRKNMPPRLTILVRCSWKDVLVKRTKVITLCNCFVLLKSLARADPSPSRIYSPVTQLESSCVSSIGRSAILHEQRKNPALLRQAKITFRAKKVIRFA